MNPLGFNETFEAFVAECKEDAKFYFDSAEALLQAYRTMCVTTSLHHLLSSRHLHHNLVTTTSLHCCLAVTTLSLPLPPHSIAALLPSPCHYHYLIVTTSLHHCLAVTTLQLSLAVTPSLAVIAAGVITSPLCCRRILTSFLNQHCKLCQKMLPVHLQHTTSPALQTGADPVGST